MRLCISQRSEASGERAGPMPRDWQGTPYPSPRAWLLSVLASLLAALALTYVLDLLPAARTFFREDGLVESLQAIVLGGVACLFALGFLRSSGSRAFFCVLAAYACIFAVTREIPRCGSAFAGGDVCLPSGWKNTIVLCASALALLALVLRPVDWRAVLRFSNLRWIWPGFVVVGFLVAAEALESLIYFSEIEEFLELAAYFHLGSMAIAILRPAAQR